jgi:ligand-binding SRPBCC domain-containing protein
VADYVREWRAVIARPRTEVFRFFSEPSNLSRITPPWLGFTIVGAPPPMAAGAILDYRVRWLGVPLRWRAFIREFDPPVRFVDVQVLGPYARWEHRHLFLETDGGTRVEDRVTYQLPMGPLGRLAHALIVQRQLDRIWSYRSTKIAELVGPVSSLPGA